MSTREPRRFFSDLNDTEAQLVCALYKHLYRDAMQSYTPIKLYATKRHYNIMRVTFTKDGPSCLVWTPMNVIDACFHDMAQETGVAFACKEQSLGLVRALPFWHSWTLHKLVNKSTYTLKKPPGVQVSRI